jgi:hypothetical protein
LFEYCQWDDLQRFYVGCAQIQPGSLASFMRLMPPHRTQAPPVTRLQTGKIILRHGCHQIVTRSHRKIQKLGCHFGADRMPAMIMGPGMAVPISIKPCHGIQTTQFDGQAQNIQLLLRLFSGLTHASLLVKSLRGATSSYPDATPR